eukprot:11457954-Alexandrium_andersonii.AAC.1
MYQLWVLLACSINLAHGPDKDQYRYNQLRECMQHVHNTQNPKTCVLFQELCSLIHADLVQQGVAFSGEQELEVEIREYLKAQDPRGPLTGGSTSTASWLLWSTP